MSLEAAKAAAKAGSAAGPEMALKAASEMVQALKDYGIVREQEITKRADIAAKRDVALELIRSRRDVINRALDGIFDERRRTLDNCFVLAERSLEKGDVQALERSLSTMLGVLRKSPTEGMGEFLQALEGGSAVIDL